MTKKRFYELSPEQRREVLLAEGKIATLTEDETSLATLAQLSENVIGKLVLPMSVISNVLINNHEYSVPMATEEPSVVAAANRGVKIFNEAGGVQVKLDREGIYGQAVFQVSANFDEMAFKVQIPLLIAELNTIFSSLVGHGGGVRQITPLLDIDILELRVLVDPAEAMGANKVNSVLETLSHLLLERGIVQEQKFAILSNYPSQLATASVSLPVRQLTAKYGSAFLEKFLFLAEYAKKNVLRAPTNNKGIMNGVDAVLLASGNDLRAVETASHVLATNDGHYRALSNWSIEQETDQEVLRGQLTLPLAIGVVGGSINSRPDVSEAYQIMGQPTVSELAAMIITIGLANNFSALLALSSTGIQAGHMKLQAKNIALANGATVTELSELVPLMLAEKKMTSATTKELINKLRIKNDQNRN